MHDQATQKALASVSTRYWQILRLSYSDLRRSHMSSIVK